MTREEKEFEILGRVPCKSRPAPEPGATRRVGNLAGGGIRATRTGSAPRGPGVGRTDWFPYEPIVEGSRAPVGEGRDYRVVEVKGKEAGAPSTGAWVHF